MSLSSTSSEIPMPRYELIIYWSHEDTAGQAKGLA